MRTNLVLAAGLAMAMASVASAQSAQLTALGLLAGGDGGERSYAYGLSSDGTRIVGGSVIAPPEMGLTMVACRWSFPLGGMASGPEALPRPATHTDFGSLAVAISDDGERIVGSIGLLQDSFIGLLYQPWQGMYWWDLSSAAPTSDWTDATMEFTDISANGQVVSGTTRSPFFEPIPADPVMWTGPGTAPVLLGSLGGIGQAFAVTADGSMIFGESFNATGGTFNTFVWDAEAGMQQLPNSPGDTFHTAMGVSPDGTYAVGQIVADASRWSAATGILNLGRAPGSNFAFALDVSADGSKVVGYSATDHDLGRRLTAFVWDAVHGLRPVDQMLMDDFGIDASEWEFHAATAISDDGRTIVGYGRTPTGTFEGWAIRIGDAPVCAADFNGDGELNPDDLSDFITCFFTEAQFPGACVQADFNSDGNIDPDDLSDYITAFFLGC